MSIQRLTRRLYAYLTVRVIGATLVSVLIFSQWLAGREKSPAQTWQIGNPVASVTLSPDGLLAAVGNKDGSIQLRQVRDGAIVRVLKGHTDEVRALAFSPDGQTLASGAKDTTVRLWHVSDGTLTRLLTGHRSAVNALAFTPDGRELASGGNDSTVRLWRVRDGAVISSATTNSRFSGGEPAYVVSLAFHDDGRMLLIGNDDASVCKWLLTDENTLETLTYYTTSMQSNPQNIVAFQAEKQTLVATLEGNEINIWRLDDGQLIWQLGKPSSIGDTGLLTRDPGLLGDVGSMAFSPDGQFLAAGGSYCVTCSDEQDFSIIVWRLSDGQEQVKFEGHKGSVTDLAWSPDTGFLVSGGSDGTVSLWNLK